MLDALTQYRAIFPEKETSPWLEAGFFYSADNRQLNYNISTQAHLRGRRGARFFVIFGVYALRDFNDKTENFNVVRQEAYPRQRCSVGGAKDDSILCDR
ncbi:hypothetical protein [Duganella sp.]|uniref:hypothetical protein n=1 Tax=Duganella sp. TaxID=1904440 RepID=UPI0031D739F4